MSESPPSEQSVVVFGAGPQVWPHPLRSFVRAYLSARRTLADRSRRCKANRRSSWFGAPREIARACPQCSVDSACTTRRKRRQFAPSARAKLTPCGQAPQTSSVVSQSWFERRATSPHPRAVVLAYRLRLQRLDTHGRRRPSIPCGPPAVLLRATAPEAPSASSARR